MMKTRLRASAGRVAAALALALGLVLGAGANPSPARAQSARGGAAVVALAPAQVAPALESLALGYDAWLDHRLASAGLRIEPLAESLEAAPAAGSGVAAILEAATGRRAVYALIPRLELRSGEVDVRVHLYKPGPQRLLAVGRSRAPLADLGRACEESALKLLGQLGLPPHAITSAPPPLLDELASSGRALAHRRVGRLGAAWREVEGKLSPTAMRLREAIAAEAQRSDAPLVERARVLAASGDPRAAWALVGSDARAALAGREPEALLLLAAGETLLARDDPRAARSYLELAARVRPDLADAHLGLGRVLALQGDTRGARAAMQRAAELAPGDPRPLVLQARLAKEAPERARLLLAAGRRAGARLDARRAERLFRDAAEFDPTMAGEVSRARGALEEELGRYREANDHYARAREVGVADVALFAGIGRAQRALGDTAQARGAFRRALELDPDEPGALRELGALYTESGQADVALPLLRRAVELAPAESRESGAARRLLARALVATGDPEEALGILEGPAEGGAAAAADLREVAAIHLAQARPSEARAALMRAIEVAPLEPELHGALAEVYRAEADPGAAERELELAQLLAGGGTASDAASTSAGTGPRFDRLLLSFAHDTSGARRLQVAHLGTREPADLRSRLAAWLHPREPARARISAGLERSMARHFDLARVPAIDNPALRAHIDRLYAFESDASLAAESIAVLNQTLGTDAVFLSRVTRASEPEPDGALDAVCSASGDLALELRMLSGRDREIASILVSEECLVGGLARYGAWNPRAAALYGLALLLVLFPLLRGWGTVAVTIALPPRTKGFFSIRVAKSPDRSVESKRKRRRAGRLRRALRLLSRFERNMAERRTVFRWIPARRRAYTVIVKGPLLDAAGDEIIGHFLEEQRVRVVRGKTAELVYDFQPKECAVQVEVLFGGGPAEGVRVAVEGVPSSLRYARDGNAFLYLGVGTHSILIGGSDRVARRCVEIRSLESAIPLCVDLAEEMDLVFRDCPEAVDPYLEGDLAACASALEAGGQAGRAQWVRAEYHRERGQLERAADLYEASGDFERAAELRAGEADLAGSAALYERAGEFDRAAQSHRTAGDLAAAARCYEAAYEYHEALECWRELGDGERELDMLEKTGAYLDAGRLARELGDAERAVVNLQQITRRDNAFCDARGLLAEVLSEQGQNQLAAETLEEAIEAAGGASAPPILRERYARMLEAAGRGREALVVYEGLSPDARGSQAIARRMEALRAEVAAAAAATTEIPARAPKRGEESRYELQAELGRGGMGVVFKARDRHLGRLVALKRLPENLRDHPGAVRMFQSEARAAAALNHRNIVTVYDAGEEDGSYFITMELLEGQPLNAILSRHRRLAAKDVARLGVQIAAGLHYAHERRIVHRDIKTANLFFTKDRVVKIMDFGLAKTIAEVRRNSTIIGGTPYFMAPEQAEGGAVDARTDLYSLGVTLYQLLTGEVPFRDGDLAYHHRHTAPPDPRGSAEDVPAVLAELVLKLLAKDPSDRCASAAEVGAALQAHCADL